MQGSKIVQRGRKPVLGEKFGSMSPAERQRRSRSLALAQLCNSNDLTGISISNLVSFLPKLIADERRHMVREICNEIIRRAG